MITFAQFLHNRGLEADQLSKEERTVLKTEYRKEYKRLWRLERNKQAVYRQLTFSKKEYRLIQQAAKKHNLSFSAFAVQAIMAYLQRMYIVLDSEQVQELRLGLKRIGVNVNQIAFNSNKTQSIHHQDVLALQLIIKELETFLHRVLTRPDDLNVLLHQALKQHPEYRQVLLTILEKQNPNDH